MHSGTSDRAQAGVVVRVRAGAVMNERVSALAVTFLDARLYLAPGPEDVRMLACVETLARESQVYATARASFDELTEDRPAANSHGHTMAFELARCGYEFGVQVGLRLRNLSDKP